MKPENYFTFICLKIDDSLNNFFCCFLFPWGGCEIRVTLNEALGSTRAAYVYIYLILYICTYNLDHSNPGIALISLIYLFVKLKALFSLFISCIIMCQYPLDIAPGYCGAAWVR